MILYVTSIGKQSERRSAVSMSYYECLATALPGPIPRLKPKGVTPRPAPPGKPPRIPGHDGGKGGPGEPEPEPCGIKRLTLLLLLSTGTTSKSLAGTLRPTIIIIVIIQSVFVIPSCLPELSHPRPTSPHPPPAVLRPHRASLHYSAYVLSGRCSRPKNLNPQ